MQLAREEMRKANEASSKQYDQKRTNRVSFTVGDLVALRIEDFTLPKDRDTRWKLRPKYAGPFKVVELLYSEYYYELSDKVTNKLATKEEKAALERLQPVACRLQLPPSWNRHHDVFPIDKLKKYNAKQQWPCQRMPPPPEPIKIGEDDDDVEYVVDRILDDKVVHSSRGRPPERHWLVGFKGYSDEYNEWLPEFCINTYADENGETVVNEIWQKYEKKREKRLQDASGRTHYLNYSVETRMFSTNVLHRSDRSLRVLLLNYRFGDEMYESIRSAYPKAHITTVGECEGPTDSSGLTTHIQVSLAKVSEYSLHATLGSPRIDIMVMNVPKVTKVTFQVDPLDHQKKQEDSYREAKVKIERTFSLFQMVSPKYWIFCGFLAGEKSKSGRMGNSFLSQRLGRETFHGRIWTNFEFDNLKGKGKLFISKLLLSGKFRNDIANSYKEEYDN